MRRQLNQVGLGWLYVDLDGVTGNSSLRHSATSCDAFWLAPCTSVRSRIGHQYEAAPRRMPPAKLLPVCQNAPRVAKVLAELEDEFPDGEEHYRVHVAKLRPEHFVFD